MIASQPRPDVTPPAFLKLAGHKLRWQLLTELARGDRVVTELTGLVGESQNLVSYHLGKLRDARLVFARRSSADRRDTYYGLDLTRVGRLLLSTGEALHPGLRFRPAEHDEKAPEEASVLFVCTGNSARSQMAEALAVSLSRGAVQAFSAGSHPKPIHPNAMRVMRDEYGLDLSGHTSKHFDALAGRHFDWVISLCDRVRERCPTFPGHPETIHWCVANPATDEPDDQTYPMFQQTAAELATRIAFQLTVLAQPKAVGVRS